MRRYFWFFIFSAVLDIVLASNGGSKSKPKVAIIGAGIAGMKAGTESSRDNVTFIHNVFFQAVDLLDAGFDVEIFEARDRIGGRLFTDFNEFGVPIEVGGAWIHGINGNPIAAVAEEAKMAIIETGQLTAVMGDGSKIDCPPADQLESLMWTVINRIKEHPQVKAKSTGKSQESVLEFMFENHDELFYGIPEHFKECLFRQVRDMQGYYAITFEEMGLGNLAVDTEFKGHHVILLEGYSKLIDFLVQKHKLTDKIRLNSPVNNISYEASSDKMQVHTHDNVLEADAVIVTVPLGVLKAGKISFEPPLPANKLEAIANIGFGVFEKVFVEFEASTFVFWPSDADSVQIMSSFSDDWNQMINSESADIVVPYCQRDPAKMSIYMVNLEKTSGMPLIVMLFHGKAAEHMFVLAKKNNQELVKFIQDRLQQAFSDTQVPEIIKAFNTKWSHDPWALGSFSNIPLTACGADMDVLAEPLHNSRLFLSGEGTISQYYSTVHGAYLSGARDAAKIINLFKN